MSAATQEPLLKAGPSKDVELGHGDIADSDKNGTERKQIKLDMWRLLAEARPQAGILSIGTIALFITAGLQLMIPCVIC